VICKKAKKLDKGLIKPVRKFGKPYFNIEDLDKLDPEPK